MSSKLDLYRRLAAQQRAELAEIQYAIETATYELRTLTRRRQSVVEALAPTEEYIKSKTESDEHYAATNE